MLSKEEKFRLKSLISETLILLCKNGLSAEVKSEFSIDGVIGITLDSEELLLVAINQVVKGGADNFKEKTSNDNRACESDHINEEYSVKSLLKGKKKRQGKDSQSPVLQPGTPDSAKKRKMMGIPQSGGSAAYTSNEQDNRHLVRTPTPNSFQSHYFPRNMPMYPFVSYTSPFLAERPDLSGPMNFLGDQVQVKQENGSESDSEAVTARPYPAFNPKMSEFPNNHSPLQPSAPMYNPFQMMPSPSKQANAMIGGALLNAMSSSPIPFMEAQHTEMPNKSTKKPKAKESEESSGSQVNSTWDAVTYIHVGQSIIRNEGCFVTSRIMTRKTGRKAKVVREILMALSVPHTHAEHIGTAREIGKNMLVFYKCPPDLIKPSALLKYGIELDAYSSLFYGALKSPPSQTILPVVLRDSPYMCAHYDKLLQAIGCYEDTSESSCKNRNTPAKTANAEYKDDAVMKLEENSNSFPFLGFPNYAFSPNVLESDQRSCESPNRFKSSSEEHKMATIDNVSGCNTENSVHTATENGGEDMIDSEDLSHNKTDKSMNESSDMENIDILNDSDHQCKGDTAERMLKETNNSDIIPNTQHGEDNCLNSFSSPLLGLQQMVKSQNSS